MQHNFTTTNKLPLGAGALAGSSFAIDQELLAEQLGFAQVYENSIDAVSDRDYLVEYLSYASLTMMHLSKLCEELIIWSSQEFGFIELDDALCTGSSMMPQKKNPDAAELIRGKTGRVYGALIGLLTTLKGLPLAYNKDLQEDKEGVFDTVNTLQSCLSMMSKMIATMKINTLYIGQHLQKGFLNATEIANYLVKKGIPFRRAHEIIGQMVKHCIEHNQPLTKEILQNTSTLFEDDIEQLLTIENIVEFQTTISGTSKKSVLNQLQAAERTLQENKIWLQRIRK